MGIKGRPRLWIRLEGANVVKNHKINAYVLGRLLTNIQKQINIIAEAKYGAKLKPHFRLFLSEIKEGSANIALDYSDSWLSREFIEKQVNVLETHYAIYDLINKGDEEELDSTLLQELKEPLDAYRLLGSIESIIPSSYKMDLSKWEPKNFVPVRPERKPLIKKLKNRYQQQAKICKIGVIMELYGKEPRHFEIETITGEKFKVYFKPELEPKLKELYKSIVELEGLATRKARVREVKKIIRISPKNTMKLDKIGEFELKQPLELSLDYLIKDNLWVIENKELAIYGEGKSFQEALRDLEESLESLIIGFLTFKDEKLAESSKKIKERLLQYLDLDSQNKKYKPIVLSQLPMPGE